MNSVRTGAHIMRRAILYVFQSSHASNADNRMTDPSGDACFNLRAATLFASAFEKSANGSTGLPSRTSAHMEKILVEARMTHKKSADAQMNLPLCETPPMALPQDKQRELAAALADLLWNAAVTAETDARTAMETTGDHL